MGGSVRAQITFLASGVREDVQIVFGHTICPKCGSGNTVCSGVSGPTGKRDLGGNHDLTETFACRSCGVVWDEVTQVRHLYEPSPGSGGTGPTG